MIPQQPLRMKSDEADAYDDDTVKIPNPLYPVIIYERDPRRIKLNLPLPLEYLKEKEEREKAVAEATAKLRKEAMAEQEKELEDQRAEQTRLAEEKQEQEEKEQADAAVLANFEISVPDPFDFDKEDSLTIFGETYKRLLTASAHPSQYKAWATISVRLITRGCLGSGETMDIEDDPRAVHARRILLDYALADVRARLDFIIYWAYEEWSNERKENGTFKVGKFSLTSLF